MLLISPRFVHAVAALCCLYLVLARFLSSIRTPITWFTVGLWLGTVLLVVAAIFPSKSNLRFAITPRRFVNGSTVFGIFGSTVTTALLLYGITGFVAFRLGYIHGKIRIGTYQPNAFDRVNEVVSKPILLLLLVSSVASLLISALIMLRNRSSSAPTLHPDKTC